VSSGRRIGASGVVRVGRGESILVSASKADPDRGTFASLAGLDGGRIAAGTEDGWVSVLH
jgi:hypothetical protein